MINKETQANNQRAKRPENFVFGYAWYAFHPDTLLYEVES